jgi:hypothetical protein
MLTYAERKQWNWSAYSPQASKTQATVLRVTTVLSSMTSQSPLLRPACDNIRQYTSAKQCKLQRKELLAPQLNPHLRDLLLSKYNTWIITSATKCRYRHLSQPFWTLTNISPTSHQLVIREDRAAVRCTSSLRPHTLVAVYAARCSPAGSLQTLLLSLGHNVRENTLQHLTNN